MPLLLISSPRESTGKTSLAVNMAIGLALEGIQVTLLDLGLIPGGIRKWVEGLETGDNGIDIWDEEIYEDTFESCCRRLEEIIIQNSGRWIIADLDGRRLEHLKCLGRIGGCLLAAVTLRDLRVEELLEWEEGIKAVRGGRGIDLIVPAIVNSHNWAENEPGIMTLMEHFGVNTVADPMPG